MNNKKMKQKRNNQPMLSTKGLQYFRYILLAALAVTIFYPPYLRGLFFESDQLPTEIFVFITFAAFWVYRLLKRDKRFLETPLDYGALGFAAVYFLSIFVSVGTREAITEWLKYCMFFSVFYMLSDLLWSSRSRIFILWVIIFSALGVCIIGIDAAAGGNFVAALNGFFESLGAGKDTFFGLFVGNRINSTLQYPNALAAYLMAVYFVCLALATSTSKIWVKVAAGASSYILIITFMLTISRGAYLFLPIAAAIYIILLPMGFRIKGVGYALPSVIGMGITLSKLMAYVAQPEGNWSNIWMSVVIGTVVSAVAVALVYLLDLWVIGVKVTKPSAYKFIRLLGIITGCFAVGLTIFIAVLVLTSKMPLELGHTAAEEETPVSVRRSVALKPEKEYKLVFDVVAENTSGKPNSYIINIASRNFAGTIEGQDTAVTSFEGKASNGKEKKEIKFKVPTDSRTVSFTFLNQYQGTKAIFSNAKVMPVNHDDKEEELVLKYKYIPESLYARLDEAKETRSGIERTIFYKDGMNIIKDHWFLGAGGGAWPLLYFSYQSYLYWTTQAHNYLVQIGVECGVIGLLVFLGLLISLVFVLINLLRYRNKKNSAEAVLQAGLFAAIAAMIMHSTIDFDLSLSAVFLALWQFIAVFNSMAKNRNAEEETGEKTHEANLLLEKLDIQSGLKKVKLYPVIGIVVTLIVLVLPITFQAAVGHAKKVNGDLNSNNLAGAIQDLKKASEVDGFSANYKIDYASLVIKQNDKQVTEKELQKADKYALQVEKTAQHNADIAAKLGAYYLARGDIQKGTYYFELSTKVRPLRPEEWKQKADAYMQVSMFYLKNKDLKNAEVYFDKILSIVSEVKEVNKRNLIPFTLTSKTQDIIEKVKFYKDNKNSNRNLDLGRIVFYSMNDMDVNSDGVPDQWSTGQSGQVKLTSSNGRLMAESAAGGSIQTRPLNFQAGRKYRVEVELANSQGIGVIPFAVSGISESNEGLKLQGNVFAAEVTTPGDFKGKDNVLALGVNGKYEIKAVSVMEK